MKKIFVLLLLVTVLSNYAYTQTDNYYYYKGKKVGLTVNEDLFYVLMTDSTIAKEKMQSLAFSNIKPVKQKEDGYWTIIKQSGIKSTTTSKIKAELLSNPQIKYVGPVFDEESPIAVSNTFCVKLKNTHDYAEMLILIQQNGCEMLGEVAYMPLWYTIKTPINSNGVNMSNRFYEAGLFEKVDPLFLFEFENNCVSDPLFNQQWGLLNTTSGDDINACQAWEITKGSPNIVVAVFDTGIDPTHDEFANNLLPHSYNAVTGSTGTVYDDHGTFVAGIIGANHNSSQISGIAPYTKLLSVSKTSTGTSIQSSASGISWAVQNGAHIINNSWGYNASIPPAGYNTELLEEAIDNALENGRGGLGCIVVFSSGNEARESVSYPANYRSEILCVGAMQNDNRKAGFSNYGTQLDVVAPGRDILSTIRNNQTKLWSGTSFAAPHVSGIAALMLAIKPTLTVQQVSDIIENTAQKIQPNNSSIPPYEYSNTNGRPNGTWNQYVGYGLVDAYTALKAVQFMDETFAISGPSQVPTFGTSYTIPGIPEGSDVVWSVSSALSPSNLNAGTLYVLPSNAASNVTIEATVTKWGITHTVKKTVSVAAPVKISGPSEVPAGGTNYTIPSKPTDLGVTWSISSTLASPNLNATTLFVMPKSATSSAVIRATITRWGITSIIEKTVSLATPIQLSGPDLVCSYGATFTLQNLPADVTVSWSAGADLEIYYTTAASLTVLPKVRERQSTVSATINNTLTLSKTVNTEIAPSGPLDIVGPETICQHCGVTYRAEHSMDPWAISGYTWNAGSGGYVTPGAREEAYMLFPNIGYTTILVARYNACGQESWHRKEIYVSGGGMGHYSAAYPNPASGSITIEKTQSTEETSAKSTKASSAATVQLYNQARQLVRESVFNGEQLSLDVSALPNGTYFLNIMENGKVVEQQTVVVKH